MAIDGQRPLPDTAQGIILPLKLTQKSVSADNTAPDGLLLPNGGAISRPKKPSTEEDLAKKLVCPLDKINDKLIDFFVGKEAGAVPEDVLIKEYNTLFFFATCLSRRYSGLFSSNIVLTEVQSWSRAETAPQAYFDALVCALQEQRDMYAVTPQMYAEIKDYLLRHAAETASKWGLSVYFVSLRSACWRSRSCMLWLEDRISNSSRGTLGAASPPK